MSYDSQLNLLAPAEALKTRLESIAELDGIDVVVDEDQDLRAAVAKATAKSKGAAIIISLEGWDLLDDESETLFLDMEHSISLWTNLIFKTGSIPPVVAEASMLRAIQGWNPGTADYGCWESWRVQRGVRGQGERYRIRELVGRIRWDVPPVTVVEE
jgi:hypothetical protein